MQQNNQQYHKFIEALEIVYSLFLAVGLSVLLLNFRFAVSYWSLVLICILTLIRFFFAPSKNIELLIEKIKESNAGEKTKNRNYRLVLLIDTLTLFIHAILFTMMCQFALLNEGHLQFYYSFFVLLVLNFIWLKSICFRIKKLGGICKKSINFWARNNMRFAIPIGFIASFVLLGKIFPMGSWFPLTEKICFVTLFILAFANCFWDLKNTYKTYLFHEE